MTKLFFPDYPSFYWELSRKELVRVILYIFGIFPPGSKYSFMRSCLFSWVFCCVVEGEFVVCYLCSLVVFASQYLRIFWDIWDAIYRVKDRLERQVHIFRTFLRLEGKSRKNKVIRPKSRASALSKKVKRQTDKQFFSQKDIWKSYLLLQASSPLLRDVKTR